MSSFFPLNLTEDPDVSKKDLIEQHSRELQIEQAISKYQEVLKLQQNGALIDSYKGYEDLFKLEIISNHVYEEENFIKGLQNGGNNTIVDELSFISPNVKLLRYLIFRNRAMLYLDILKHGLVEELCKGSEISTPKEKFIELFFTLIDNLCISLIYQEGDEKLLDTLYDIFMYIKAYRLAKFTLEYTLTGKTESDDILGLVPVNSQILVRYRWLKGLLFELELSTAQQERLDAEIARIDHQYSYLAPIVSDLQVQIDKTVQLNVVKVSLTKSMDWLAVIDMLNAKINSFHDKQREFPRAKFKYLDPYTFTDTPLERFRFQVVEEELVAGSAAAVAEVTEAVVEGNEETLSTADDKELKDVKTQDTESNMEDIVPDNNGENVVEDTKMEAVEASNDTIMQSTEDSIEKDEANKDELTNEEQTNEEPNKEEPNKEDNIDKTEIDKTEPEKSETDKIETDKVEVHQELKLDNSEEIRNKPQRSSKRLAKSDAIYEQPEIIIKKEYFVETTRFFESLQQYFELLNTDETKYTLDNIVNQYVPENGDEHALYLSDFMNCLNDWHHPSYSTSILIDDSASKTSEDEKVKLLDVLSGFAKAGVCTNDDVESLPQLSEYETATVIKDFLLSLNDTENHFVDLKMKIITRLLGFLTIGDTSICLITDTVWPRSLSNAVKEWILQFENIMLQDFKFNSSQIEEALSVSIAVHEVLVDTSVTLQQQISATLSQKHQKYNKQTNWWTLELVKVRDSLRRWELFIQELLGKDFENKERRFVLEARYKWSLINNLKSLSIYSEDNKYAIIQLHELSDFAKNGGYDLQVKLPNYGNISEINLEVIKNQLTTLSVLDMFSRILNQSDYDNPEAIRLLEFILLGNVQTLNSVSNGVDSFNEEAISAIKNFLDNSPIEMKLSLWSILFLYYTSNKKKVEFQLGFEHNLQFLMSYISGTDYKTLAAVSRPNTLVKILGFLGVNLKLFLSILAENKWNLPNNEIIPINFAILLKLFELFYIFSIHEEAAMISTLKVSVLKKSRSSFQRLKDIFLRITTLVVIYFKSYLFSRLGENENSRHQVSNLITLVHEQLGIRNVCSSSNGLFLRMAQETLIALNCESANNDLAQIIRCRYHYSITIGTFVPKDHATEVKEELDEVSTKELARFILPQCFHKNPLVHIPKQDTKLIIDAFYEVIGIPQFESSPVLTRNLATLDDFLDTSIITSRFMRDLFYGLLSMDFDQPEPNLEIIKNGLYYLEAVLIFASYKIKKKNLQSRVVDLENIIQLLKSDLIYCTQRVESWYLLGQAYGYLVEDDVIWTADKLTSPDRKIQTANLQRKSLICYLLAINGTIGARSEKEKQFMKPIIGGLMSSFAKEMYSACMIPMDMHAFKVQMFPKFVHKEQKNEFVSVALNSSIPLSLCLKIMQQALHLSIKAGAEDWTNYYYLSKIQKRLNKGPKLVLETMLKASNLAFKESTLPERIIEPHYTICSLVYKYYKKGQLTYDEALVYYKEDPVINLSGDPVLDVDIKTNENFYGIVVKALRKVDAYDKKHWHHKPRYRLSKVLFEEFGNCAEAIELMSSLVSVKASSKTLVLIWKPENERPGKHFYYTFQYAKFFIELLTYNNDLANLVHMFPRLRRSNSMMIKLYTAWESICSSVCKIMRQLIGVGSSFVFTDSFMQKLVYLSFMPKSKSYIETMLRVGIPKELEPHMCFLYALNDMKKFNSGFGPTSLIDDTIVSIYFKFYIHYDKDVPEANGDIQGESNTSFTDSPGTKNKKIAKRDIFPFTAEILKNGRREIENILKENPDIYNDFVNEAIAKQKKEETELMNKIVEVVEEDRKEAVEEQLQNNEPVNEDRTLSAVQEFNQDGSESPCPTKSSREQVVHYTSFPIMPSYLANNSTEEVEEVKVTENVGTELPSAEAQYAIEVKLIEAQEEGNAKTVNGGAKDNEVESVIKRESEDSTILPDSKRAKLEPNEE